MFQDVLTVLRRQLDTAWELASLHLHDLTTEECLWRPAPHGPHVHRDSGGSWRADWPEHEGYDLGPPSIAWLTWHVAFWWAMVLDHSFGEGRLARDDLAWPGNADAVRDQIEQRHDEWLEALNTLTSDTLRSSRRTRWPFRDRPFADVVAWVNIELTKNASEIGYARFLYSVRTP